LFIFFLRYCKLSSQKGHANQVSSIEQWHFGQLVLRGNSLSQDGHATQSPSISLAQFGQQSFLDKTRSQTGQATHSGSTGSWQLGQIFFTEIVVCSEKGSMDGFSSSHFFRPIDCSVDVGS